MKRASKILTLILIVVFVLSVFAGCDLIGKDIAKYRATVAMKVGNEEITIGKLLDTYNNYYNNYYYYVSAGYFSAEDLLEMAISSLQQQYMQIDDYVKTHEPVTPALAKEAHNAEYLEKWQYEYCIKYVKHISFTSFDSTVLTTLSAKHDIKDAEDEDTSRDFTEYDKLLSETSYSEHLYLDNFESEDADEYFEKYYNNSVDFSKVTDLDYIYKTEEEAATILKELNDRLEDDEDEITFEEYKDAQEKAVNQYRDTVMSNYKITLEQFMKNQVADMVSSCILAMWSYQHYEGLEGREDFASMMERASQELKAAQDTKFNLEAKGFDSFITGLSNNSYLYSVPTDMQGKYVFVKNILIPFSSQQTNRLNVISAQQGGTDNDEYRYWRNVEASKVWAQYFDSDKYEEDIEKVFTETGLLQEDDSEDAKYKYKKVGNLFNFDGTLSVNSEGILGNFFGSENKVTPIEGKTESETIIELMKRFNTDTAQHTSRYDYVVYVGEDWKDYSHSWVEEFYTAVNELRDESGNFNGQNKYTLCVSTYGVHIIYVEEFVEEIAVFEYNANDWNKTETLSYVRYSTEFQKVVSKVTQDAFEELQKTYLSKNLLTANRNFKRFLKDNEFTDFSFDDYLKELKDELKIS